jgi:hypothetical protein
MLLTISRSAIEISICHPHSTPPPSLSLIRHTINHRYASQPRMPLIIQYKRPHPAMFPNPVLSSGYHWPSHAIIFHVPPWRPIKAPLPSASNSSVIRCPPPLHAYPMFERRRHVYPAVHTPVVVSLSTRPFILYCALPHRESFYSCLLRCH